MFPDSLSFLPATFSEPVLGSTLTEWAFFALVWAAVTLALWLMRKLIAGRLVRFAAHTKMWVDDLLADMLVKTRFFFLLLLGLFVAATVMDLSAQAMLWIGRLVFLGVLLQVVLWGNSLITLGLDTYRERKLETHPGAVTTMQAAGFLGRIVLWSLVLLLALDNLGIDVTALVASLGVGGIAVALAVQNILGDLFASLSIVMDKPFVVGDFLIVGEHVGTVEHIGLKTTRLRSLSGEQLVFSNSDLLGSRIRNFKRMFERRVVFGFGVTYQTPADTVAAIGGWVREIIDGLDTVRFDRAHFKGFGDSSLDFEAVYYVTDPDFNLYMDRQEAINLALMRLFEAHGVEFAYPTQTLYVQRDDTERAPRARQPEYAAN